MTKPKAYYNEFNPKAAAWLRELIADGLIADGDVDERSITEVQPEDLNGYTQVHFFAGIGGWSRALRLAGWPDEFPVWTGSCPCQPFSCAGKGQGVNDERHLWPEMFRLVRECRPAIVVGEQVAAAIKHGWLDGVFADMEGIDYACGAADLPACSVGAPHIRQRIFWVADAGGQGSSSVRIAHKWSARSIQSSKDCADGDRLADAGCSGDECGMRHREAYGADGAVEGEAWQRERGWTDSWSRRSDGGLVHAEQPGLEGHAGDERNGREPGRIGAQASGSTSEAGGAGFWADCILIPCRDGKARRAPAEPEIFPLVDGLSFRLDGRRNACAPLLKGGGNAINPVVAAEFIMAAMEAMR